MRSFIVRSMCGIAVGVWMVLSTGCVYNCPPKGSAGGGGNGSGYGSNTVHQTLNQVGAAGTYTFKRCTTKLDCESGGPPNSCWHRASSYCGCEFGQYDPNKLSCNTNGGVCVWQVNPEDPNCACIPGSTQPCVDGKKRTCGADGTRWTACS
jgi:hypothetical protein